MNRGGKWLVLGLLASLGLNLLVVGFIAARVLHGPRHEPGWDGPGAWSGPRRWLHRPDSDAASDRLLGHLLEQHGDAFRSQRGELQAARAAVHRAWVAEPFDAAALHQAFEQLRKATADSQALMHGALLELATSSTPEERRQLARSARFYMMRGELTRPDAAPERE